MKERIGTVLRASALGILILAGSASLTLAQTAPEPSPPQAPAPETPPPGLTPPTGAADTAAPASPAPAATPADPNAPAAEAPKPNLPPLPPILELRKPDGAPIVGPDARPLNVPAMVDPRGFPVFGPNGTLVPLPVQYDAQGNPVIGPDGRVATLSGAQAPVVPVLGADGQPIVGPTGIPLVAPALIGVDGKPVLDATGAMIPLAIARDMNGTPLLTAEGLAIVAAPDVPDKLPLLDNNGQPIIGQNGQPLLVPIVRDEAGRPILGLDGKPRRSEIKTDDTGRPILGADGQPLLAGEEEEKTHDLTPYGMFMQATVVVKVVMILLISMSVLTWAYTFAKFGFFASLTGTTNRFLDMFRSAKSLEEAASKLGRRDSHPAARMMQAALTEIDETGSSGMITGEKRQHLMERVSAAVGVAQNSAATEMGQGMTLFAIIASNSPFIGLFGTVFGIMNAFIGIAETNTTNLAVVAPGIAEALFATGLGLFAAIPAAIFYNIFARRITQYNAQLENFAGELMVRVSRHLDQRA